MSYPNYKIIFNDETKYVVQDITEEPVVRVIPARGEPGPQGEDGKSFEPTVVSELPATGEENKLYLTPKPHTTQTVTGNPITATITEESGTLESFQLDGDTFQQSYEGKNLLPVAQRQSQTKSGITLTINNDGSFDISGTSTANTNFDFIMPLSQSGIVGGASYTISSNQPVGNVRYYVHSCEQGGAWRKTLIAFIQDGTLTAAEPTTDYINFVINVQQGVSVSLSGVKTMIELGSTATSYEPFVGGQPSPNPEYPQPIQTVTGTQTVEIQGKNLFVPPESTTSRGVTFTKNSDGSFDISGKAVGGEALCYIFTDINLQDGDSLTLSSNVGASSGVVYRVEAYSDSAWIAGLIAQNTTMPKTITIPQNTTRLRYAIGVPEGREVNLTNVTFQLEKGSATAYAPYSKQTLPLDLDTIELCKLGDYQDYIWKDGEDWKVHKATKTITASSNDFSSTSSSGGFRRAVIALADMADSGSGSRRVGSAITNLFHPSISDGASAQFQTLASMVIYASSTTQTYQELMDSIDESGMVVTYALATSTDTVITDQTLIAQLEAIRTASLENGANTITNIATDPNLAGDMEISYYSYNPRNRYNKWLWLDINNEYEQLNNPDTTALNSSSTRNLNLTSIQSVSNEINNDEERENVTFNDVEDL